MKGQKMTEKQTSGYSVFVPEVWSQKLNQMLEKNCVMLQCVNRNWEGEIKNQGDTVKIITPAKVSVSTLTSDNITYSDLAPTSQDLVIDQKKFFAFKIDDVSKVQANADIMEAHLSNAGKAIEEVQDSFLLGLHTDVLVDNTVGSEDSPITLSKTTIYEQFVKLSLRLKNSDAVHAGVKPWVVINPDIEAYLLQSPEFISAYNVADETLREGSIGRIAGMDVLVSTNLTEVDGKYYVLAGTNDAITFASQLSKIESLRDKDSFSDLVRGLYLYGAKTIEPKALAKMVISAA
jgi:N4-gp56 family major capsid protein